MLKEVKLLMVVAILAVILGGVAVYYGYTAVQELGTLRSEMINVSAASELMKSEPAMAAYLETYASLGETLVKGMQEGKVVWYSCHTLATSEAMVAAFNKKFPYISVDIVQESSYKLYERFKSEQDAGKYLADVCVYTGAPIHERLKNEGDYMINWTDPALINFAPEVKDPEGYYVSVSQNAISLGVNKQMTQSLWPTDWTDFLNPKPQWSRISIYDPRISSTGYSLVYNLWKKYGETQSASIWQSIKTLSPMYYTGTTPLTEALVAGEQNVTLYMMNYQYGPYKIDKGANIETIAPTSGIGYTVDGTVGLVKRAPHPNAAKVFIHWFISSDCAQSYLSQYRYSTRLDVGPPTGLPDVRQMAKLPMDEVEAESVRDTLLAKWTQWMGL